MMSFLVTVATLALLSACAARRFYPRPGVVVERRVATPEEPPSLNLTGLLRLIHGAGKRPHWDAEAQAKAVRAVSRLTECLENSAPVDASSVLGKRDLYLSATEAGWVLTVSDYMSGDGRPANQWYILLPRGFGMKPVVSRDSTFPIVDRIATLDG